jgi:hypothetical protein
MKLKFWVIGLLLPCYCFPCGNCKIEQWSALQLTLPRDQANLNLDNPIWATFSANVSGHVLSGPFDDCLRHICGSGRQRHIHIPFDTPRNGPFDPIVRQFPNSWINGVDNGWILFHTQSGQDELNYCVQCYHQRQPHDIQNLGEWSTCCNCLQELAQKFWIYQNAPNANRQFSFFEVSYENIRHLRGGHGVHAHEYKNPNLHSIKIRFDRIFSQQNGAQEWHDFLTRNWGGQNYANIANSLLGIRFNPNQDICTGRYNRRNWRDYNTAYTNEIQTRGNVNFIIVTLVIGIDAVHNTQGELERALRTIDPWDKPDSDAVPIREKIDALNDLLTSMRWHVCSFYIR